MWDRGPRPGDATHRIQPADDAINEVARSRADIQVDATDVFADEAKGHEQRANQEEQAREDREHAISSPFRAVDDPQGGNPYLTVRIATGFGQGRNVLIPQSCRGVIAIAGGYGTLSEIAFCRKLNVPLVGLGTWEVDGSFPVVEEPEEAVGLLFERMDV